MVVLWWYWVALGLVLIALELVIPSFTIIWFGAAALLVGILQYILPTISLAVQLLVWIIFSVGFAFGWFRFFKPQADRTFSGLSKEAALGHTGTIIRQADEGGRGVVKFQVAVMGADEWSCFADSPLEIGDRVRIIDVEGHALKVVVL